MRRDRPLKREGTVEDVAEAALYLAADRSRDVTGTVPPIDGGMRGRQGDLSVRGRPDGEDSSARGEPAPSRRTSRDAGAQRGLRRELGAHHRPVRPHDCGAGAPPVQPAGELAVGWGDHRRTPDAWLPAVSGSAVTRVKPVVSQSSRRRPSGITGSGTAFPPVGARFGHGAPPARIGEAPASPNRAPCVASPE